MSQLSKEITILAPTIAQIVQLAQLNNSVIKLTSFNTFNAVCACKHLIVS